MNLAAHLIGVPKPNGNRSNLLNKICVQPRIQATAKPSTAPQHTCMGVCPQKLLELDVRLLLTAEGFQKLVDSFGVAACFPAGRP